MSNRCGQAHWYQLGQPESGVIHGRCRNCGKQRDWSTRPEELGFVSSKMAFESSDPYGDVAKQFRYQRPGEAIAW